MQQDLLREIRLNVNEGMEKLNKDVRKFGKMLRGFVKFFVAIFLFALLNLWIDVFTKHTHLLSVNTFRLLEEGLHAFVNQNVMTFVSIISEHFLDAAMAVFAGAFETAVIAGVLVRTKGQDKGDNKVREHKQEKQDCATVSCPVSYRQKVCFLS